MTFNTLRQLKNLNEHKTKFASVVEWFGEGHLDRFPSQDEIEEFRLHDTEDYGVNDYITGNGHGWYVLKFDDIDFTWKKGDY
jgi:hypothetical protein